MSPDPQTIRARAEQWISDPQWHDGVIFALIRDLLTRLRTLEAERDTVINVDPQTLRSRVEQHLARVATMTSYSALEPESWALIRELLAALPQWQDIATAPMDGTKVRLWLGGVWQHEDIGAWKAVEGPSDWPYVWHCLTGRCIWSVPTHWMPLPAPPALEDVRGE